MKSRKIITVFSVGVILLFMQFNVSAMRPDHPHYLHALADLRAARWMIEHRPGNWIQTIDEIEAVKRIDEAINEIKRAAIDDGKDITDHVGTDERPDHMGRLRNSVEFLKKAREDVNKDEDNGFAQGLQRRAIVHITEAIRLTKRAIRSR